MMSPIVRRLFPTAGEGRRSIRYTGFAVAAIIASVAACRAEEAKKRPAKEVAAEMWKTIQNTAADPDKVDPNEKRREVAYWFSIGEACEIAFYSIERADDRDAALEYFVDQFGKHGPEADMRWFFAGYVYVLPDQGQLGSLKEWPPKFYHTRMKICELITRRCLRDSAMRQRYFRAIGALCCSANRQLKMKEALSFLDRIESGWDKKRRSREYWWHARNFVLLVHSFGRDDLLRDADPALLDKQFSAFAKWVRTNKDFFVPDIEHFCWRLDEKARAENRPNRKLPSLRVPDMPFGDWPKNAVRPPTPEEFDLYVMYNPPKLRRLRYEFGVGDDNSSATSRPSGPGGGGSDE